VGKNGIKPMASNIRVATPSDAAAVLEIYGPFCEDSPITFETRIPALAEMEGRIRGHHRAVSLANLRQWD
jgi:L-amino acid N-acyltransferase YncA